MTVASQTSRVSYSGNGSTVLFAVPFYFLENGHLRVVLRSSAGVETIQIITTNYTVTGAGNPSGGSITMTLAPASGETLVIVRNVPVTQETDYQANDPFPAESHERALDKLTMIAQQSTDIGNRAVKIPETETSNTLLPVSGTRATKMMGFDAAGGVTISSKTIAAIDAAVTTIETLSLSSPGSSAAVSHIASGTGATSTTVQAKLRETISVKDFGAIGDGIVDDTTAIQNAAAAATAQKKSLYAPAGTYKMITGVTITHGLIGDGPNNTIFQGVNDGTVKSFLITTTTSGTGLYAGFTLDGACSADPVAWDALNYNSFTGHTRTFTCGGSKIVISNVVSQNSVNAPFHCELGNDVVFENCKAIRGRGGFGDGFYIQRSHRVTLKNCVAEDITRIGFVCEGGLSGGGAARVCERVTFIGCHAENAHDQGVDYGGTEFNAGFWFENSTLNTCIGCTTKDTGNRGFTFAGTTLVGTVGYSVSQATYINCHADTAAVGFIGQSLSSSIEAIITYDNCTVQGCGQGFSQTNATVTINNCSYFFDGGGGQTRAISTETNAVVFVNGFYEEWLNKPVNDLDPLSDAGSISRFSTNNPRQVVIDGYRTYNDAYFTVKYRAQPPDLDLVVKNGKVIFPRVVAINSLLIENCVIEVMFTTGASNSFMVKNCTFTGNAQAFLYGDNSYVQISNSKFERLDEAEFLYIFNNSNTTAKPKVFINNCSFVGDVETGSELIFVNTDTPLASTSRCADLVLNGCTFFNTGGSTTNPAIVLNRGAGTSTVYGTSNWKSATLTNLATRTATGSTTADLL